MSAQLLQAALADSGIDAEVEARGKLAVLTARSALPLDTASRRRIVAMAQEQGFTNVAIELGA